MRLSGVSILRRAMVAAIGDRGAGRVLIVVGVAMLMGCATDPPRQEELRASCQAGDLAGCIDYQDSLVSRRQTPQAPDENSMPQCYRSGTWTTCRTD